MCSYRGTIQSVTRRICEERVRLFRDDLEDLMREVRQVILKGMSLKDARQTICLPKYDP